MTRLVSLALFVVGACGGSDDPPAVDASGSGNIDAPAATVQAVEPCVGESATVSSEIGFMYTPMATTITQGQIVKFVNRGDHDVAPTGISDTGLRVGFGATKCLRFTKAGTFNFKCTPHGFVGSITVN